MAKRGPASKEGLRRRLGATARLGQPATIALVLVWTIALAFVQRGALGAYLDARLLRPAYFKLRTQLGRDPDLDPHLKILSYDDTSVDRLQRPDLTIDDWATVLAAIAAAKPRLVLIDKMFSIAFDPNGQIEQALAKLGAIDVPIVVGAFVTQQSYAVRHPLDLSTPYFRVDPGALPLARNPFHGWNVYGPAPLLRPVLPNVGHIRYEEDGLVHAFVAPTDTAAVPHLSLLAARHRVLTKDGFTVDDRRLPLDDEGRLIVDFAHVDRYFDRARRLGGVVLAAREGRPVPVVKEGDTVIILPEMFTGSTDLISTPHGIMPGGFIIASLANSVLTGRWIGRVPGELAQLLLLTALGALWGARARARRFWSGLAAATATLVLFGVWLFAWRGVVFSALAPLAGMWGGALVLFADRTRAREREATRLRTEMDDAAEMAKAFRPDDAPRWSRYDIASFHRSLSEASGDWYAFREAPSGRLQHFVLCDITGHGVQAALMVSICKTMLAYLVRQRPEALEERTFLQTFARELNAMLVHHGKGQHLLTLLGLTFEAETGQVHVVSAGHPPPLHFSLNYQGDRRFGQLAVRSTVLGLAEGVVPKLVSFDLRSGDELIAYTDGLPVGRHIRAVNAFFAERAYAFENAPAALLDAVWAQETRRTGRTLDDDVSIVWFKAS